MARAVRGTGAGGVGQLPHGARLDELASKLEDLARAQDEARSRAGDDEPDYVAAFGRLFTAVARLNPLHAATEVRNVMEVG